MTLELSGLLDAPLGVCTKGLPDDLAQVPLGQIGALGLSLWRGDPLLPALELWTDVLSSPEPGRAIIGAGRRDAPYDAGLPTVLRAYRRGEPVTLGTATVTELNDQHGFVSVAPPDALAVGDLVCLGISHPCGAFDRWRTLLEVDEGYTVTRAIRTFF